METYQTLIGFIGGIGLYALITVGQRFMEFIYSKEIEMSNRIEKFIEQKTKQLSDKEAEINNKIETIETEINKQTEKKNSELKQFVLERTDDIERKIALVMSKTITIPSGPYKTYATLTNDGINGIENVLDTGTNHLTNQFKKLLNDIKCFGNEKDKKRAEIKRSFQDEKENDEEKKEAVNVVVPDDEIEHLFNPENQEPELVMAREGIRQGHILPEIIVTI